MCVRFSVRMFYGLLLAALPLLAEEPSFNKDLKVRWAYAPSTQDNLRRAAQGFGLNFGWATGFGRLGLELGYSYKTGDAFYVAPQGAAPGDKQAIDRDHSGDSRRNQLDGFHARIGLTRPWSEGLQYQVGLQLGGTRFRHEYRGDIRSVEWNESTPNSWRDSYSGTPEEGGLKVSPYAGVTLNVSDRSSLECNVVLLNYTALEFVHKPGSGTYALPEGSQTWAIGPIAPHNSFKSDRLEKRNRLLPQLEFAYVFHF